MAVESEKFRTLRGDELVVTLFTHAGEDPTIMVTLSDADDTPVPTAEFTLKEAGAFRDSLRRLCEEGWRSTSWPTRWP
jgi:hypothetical protein